jgi:hypothetical protein
VSRQLAEHGERTHGAKCSARRRRYRLAGCTA